jgi:hypothetical protein
MDAQTKSATNTKEAVKKSKWWKRKKNIAQEM